MTAGKKLRVGVVGLGHQSLEDHIPAILASPDVELVGVSDVDKEKLKDFSKENSNIAVYDDAEKLFGSEKLDFVVIAIPHYLHTDITKKAIEHKIHVLKEKPFAMSLKEGKEIKQLAEKNNVKVSLTLQRRFNPIYSTFFQFIDKIGSPFIVDAKYTFYTDAPHEGWRGKKEFAGGGCLIDMGYHMTDLLMWYLGLPDSVAAEISCNAKENISYDAEDTAKIIFNYSSKCITGSLLVSRVIPPKTEYFDVYGTRGIIHIERGKIERRAPNGEVQESLSREHRWPSATQDQLEYFIKVLSGKKDNVTGPDFNFNHLAFIEAAYRSRDEQKFINPADLLKENGIE